MEEVRKQALALYLDTTVEDIHTVDWSDKHFEIGVSEYLVLTDEEADEAVADYIKETAWAFNTNFIIEHSKVLDFDKASESIVDAIREQYESGNEAILKLIDDVDEFIEDAISADGRGHFISGYDGETMFYIYRTN